MTTNPVPSALYNWLQLNYPNQVTGSVARNQTASNKRVIFDFSTNTIKIDLGTDGSADISFSSSNNGNEINCLWFQKGSYGYNLEATGSWYGDYPYTDMNLTQYTNTEFKKQANWSGDSTGIDFTKPVIFKFIKTDVADFVFTMSNDYDDYSVGLPDTTHSSDYRIAKGTGANEWPEQRLSPSIDPYNYGVVFGLVNTNQDLVFGARHEWNGTPGLVPWNTLPTTVLDLGSDLGSDGGGGGGGGGSGDPFITTFRDTTP